MFNLIAVRDTVPVAPKTFGIDPAITIQDALNKKFANRLIPERGLALSVFDILTAEDGRVTWGNGQMFYKVSFRLVLFAPFVGEVILGKVHSTTPEYIRVSLGFFQDVYIPPTLLPPGSAYDDNEKRFFWYPGDDANQMDEAQLLNTIKAERFYYDPGEPIRFRVDSIEWHENEPGPPQARKEPEEGADAAPAADDKGAYERAGYRIIAAVAEQGLGLISWWGENEAGGEEGEEVVEEAAVTEYELIDEKA
ncbi:hypothetical protein VHUM_01457 [Vanrija humicola]|uniref:RNA polymerase III subunit Rpc25 domain-containing protein n=1 Tax=Vanrija humicola TaxID=5417 RepID=A0A7D8Z806_VANHU|nr:hypothetical protein VHUM_01457 [Vanrija humicola]